MSPLIVTHFMAAAAFFTMGLLHAFVWARKAETALVHSLFALTAFAASANAMAEAGFYRAETVEQFNAIFRWANNFNALWAVALLWFVVYYTNANRHRRRVAWALSGIWLLLLLVNIWTPYGPLYAEITGLRPIALPWGERIVLADGLGSRWGIVADFALLALLGFVGDGAVRLWRYSENRRALVLGFTLIVFIVAFAVHGRLVDTGVLELPYLTTYSYLIVALAMSYELAGEVVRASVLAREVVANERRWHSLLENVGLLVVGADRDGRVDYVNPCFREVSGYSSDEILGKRMTDFLEPGEKAGDAYDFARPGGGAIPAGTETRLRTKHGDERDILWWNVLLRGRQGEMTGSLRVGAEITEQRRAESARDEALSNMKAALREVETLKARLEDEVVYLRDELKSVGHFGAITGDSEPLKYVLRRIEQVAPLSTTVLIEGETGVGKELVARAIHELSPRSSRPLVKIDCASLPASLIEAELFGHERGAYTGATRRRMGRFELANGGTLFLDEIGELPLELQTKLLRVLQDGEFERLGGETTLKADVRIIAATNRRLQDDVSQGRYREDLYYRLNVYPITVPALRQRKEDIPALVEAFVQRFAKAHGRNVQQIPKPVMDELMTYEWPGNIRELENVIERAVITSSDDTLRLAERLRRQGAAPFQQVNGAKVYRGPLEEVEKEYVNTILELSGWRIEGKDGAAERLGLHPNTLRSRMRKLGIQRRGQ